MRTEYYTERVSRCEEQITQLKRQSNRWLMMKIVFFLVACYAAWQYVKTDGLPLLVLALLAFAIYILALVRDNKTIAKCEQTEGFCNLYRRELHANQGKFTVGDGTEYADDSHPYSADIDIFGSGSLFQRINRCHTKAGADALARLLTDNTIYDDRLHQHAEAVAELAEMNGFREQFMVGAAIDKLTEVNVYDVSMFSDRTVNRLTLTLKLGRITTAMLLLYLLVATLLSWSTACAVVALTTLFTVQLAATYLLNSKTSKASRRAGRLIKSYSCYLPLMRLFVSQTFTSSLLADMQRQIATYIDDSSEVDKMEKAYTLRANPILWVVLNGFWLTDLSALLSFARWAGKRLDQLPKMEEAVGYADCLVSCAQYNFNHPEGCLAVVDSDVVVAARECYHPFMTKAQTVPNSLTVLPSTTSIVTGANMSGKSTFLRSMALNLVMARCGLRVAATEFRFHPEAQLFTCMRVSDNINRGISYFQSEIMRLSRLIAYVAYKPRCLILLDEVLRGTNSDDKLQGTIKLLRYLAQRQYTVVIATHDIAVAKLENEQPDVYRNYCFEIVLSDPPVYPYTLSAGVCKNKNATYLLEQILT